MNVDELRAFVTELKKKVSLNDEDIYKLVRVFNHEMLDNVDGPNCTDLEVCSNNCCGIMIDIPDLLARKYIIDNHLKSEIRRGDVFTWKLDINRSTSRCYFFSEKLNGCQIYVDNLDIRPPQCAVYPAGYEEGATKCKSGAGPWLVKNIRKGKECKELMEIYKNYCLDERERMKETLLKSIPSSLREKFAGKLETAPPSSVAGILDTLDGFEPLSAGGKSFSFKRFCEEAKPDCNKEYLQCENVCKEASQAFNRFLLARLPLYIRENDMKEEYLLLELKKIEIKS
ncbi:MAG: hypothetical protein ACFFCS_08200 [Candidatus Hodarchaeota archaeon]